MRNRRNPYLNLPILAATMTVSFVTSAVQAGTTWDGTGSNTNINTKENWNDELNPTLTGGTSTLTFGTGGSTATINTSVSVAGIILNRNANFAIADGAGSLTIGSGGITVTLPTTTARTHTISESSIVLGANQTWSITNNTGAAQLDVTGIISGSSRSITKTGTGTLRLTGVNTFSGGLSVNEGTVLAQTTGSALGAGVVNLGATTAGTNNVILALGTSSTFANDITVRSGNSGTVTINNFGDYNPTLSGQITLNKGLILNNNDNSSPFTSLRVSGKLTGASGLTITGSNIAGETILSNSANDYTGTTAVNSGTLRLTGNLGNTAVTVASGAAIAGEGSIGATGSLTFNNGSFLKVDGSTAGALSVGGNLSLAATTHVILDGVPVATGSGTSFRLLDYGGSLTGNFANLALQNAANYRSHSFSTATANQVNMTIDTMALTWSGASAAWDINSSLNWNSGAEKFYQGDSVAFTDSGTTKAVTLAATVIPASVTFSNTTGNNYSLTGAGAIAGASSLTKTDGGTVTLSTANTYSGGTTISGGKIIATVANALGTGAVTNNATLDLTAGAVTYTGLSSSMTGNGTVNVTLGTTGTSAVNLSGDYSGFTGMINIGDGAAAGAGRLQMNGLDSASSMVNVLNHGSVFAFGASVTKNATLTLNGGNTGESLGQLRLDGGATWAGDVILAGDVVAGDFTVGSNGGGGTISGDISETGGPRALSKGGPSTITLSGSNSYTGLTTNHAGILRLGSAGALGGAIIKTSGLTVTGGTLDLFGQTPSAVVPLALNSSSNSPDVGSLYNTSGTTATWTGTVSLGTTTVVLGSGNINLTNTITGNSNNLNKNGLGTLALTNSGNVTLGTLQINRGGIDVGSGTTIGTTGLNIGSGSSVGASLNLNGGSVEVSSTGSVSLSTGTSTTTTVTLGSGSTLTVPNFNKGSGGTALVLNMNGGKLMSNAASTTFMSSNAAFTAKVQAGGAVIHDGGFAITIGQALIHDTALDSPSVTPDGGLTKQGPGSLTLAGTNTYTGETEIAAGTLALGSAGSIANSSQIIVGANTTFDVSAVSFTLGASNAQQLSGTGTITGNMTVGANGTLAIGSSPGTMTFGGDLDLNTGSISNFEINGFTLGNYDLALAATAGSQTVDFGGGTLNLLFQSGFSTIGSVKIFDFDFHTGSGFASVVPTGLASGFTATFDSSTGIVTVIPEPRAALLGGLGLVALLLRRRA